MEEIIIDIQNRFGDNAPWAMLTLVQMLDMKTFTFPEWIKSSVVSEFAEYIENNEKLKRLFMGNAGGNNHGNENSDP